VLHARTGFKNLLGSEGFASECRGMLVTQEMPRTRAYDLIFAVCRRKKEQKLAINLHEGVLPGTLAGPDYERPAKFSVRDAGADMLYVHVPQVWRHQASGSRVLGISCVTNMAAGITGNPSLPRRFLKPVRA